MTELLIPYTCSNFTINRVGITENDVETLNFYCAKGSIIFR